MAILDHAINHIRSGRPVFPGLPNEKRPAILNPYESATLDEKQILRWWKENPNYNICLPMGVEIEPGVFLGAIDFDTKNDNGFETASLLADLDFLFDLTLTQITPSGEHWLYTFEKPIGNGVGLIGPGIDHRGIRGYIIGEGSWYRGLEYTFKNELPIARAPIWLAEKCYRKQQNTVLPLSVVGSVDQGIAGRRGRAFLQAMGPTKVGERNSAAFKNAAMLRDFGCSLAATRDLMSTEWKTELPLDSDELETTIQSVFKTAKNAAGIRSVEAAFEVIAPTIVKGPKNPLEEMNDEYSFCMMGGKPSVLWHKKKKTEVISVEGFHAYNLPKVLQVDGQKPRQLSDVWMRSTARKTYDGMIFDPSSKDPRYYNVWQGFTAKPLEGQPPAKALKSLATFKEHIIKNVARGIQSDADWLFTWLAHIFQKPGEKPRTGVVLRGGKGVGKSAIFDCISKLLGAHYVRVSGRRYITGNFNAHLEGKLLYVLEEAFWAKDKNADSILKDLVTSPDIQIERKGYEAYSTKNLCRVVVIGNAEWLVDASADERRYAAFEVGENNRGDQEFFAALVEDMDPGLLLKFFLEWDLSKANINIAPKTKALLKQKAQSAKPLEQWWEECMQTGLLGDEWPESILASSLRVLFCNEMKNRNFKGALPGAQEISCFLKKASPSMRIKRKRADIGREKAYYFSSIASVREEWDQYNGQPGEYEPEDQKDLV